MGADGHGQDVTVRLCAGVVCLQPIHCLQKAARRACRNAIEFNSLPSMGELIPGGKGNMKLHVKIGTPRPVR